MPFIQQTFSVDYLQAPPTWQHLLSFYGHNSYFLVHRYGHCKRDICIRKGKHRLRVLRRIFGPKRDEVMGDWRKTAYSGAP
jgi:hypothetical protein